MLYCKKSCEHQAENMRSPLIIVDPFTYRLCIANVSIVVIVFVDTVVEIDIVIMQEEY